MLDDDGWVLNDLATKEALVIIIEVHPYQLARVEQPIVVVWKSRGMVSRKVANIFASGVGVLRTEDAETTVIGERCTDDPLPLLRESWSASFGTSRG